MTRASLFILLFVVTLGLTVETSSANLQEAGAQTPASPKVLGEVTIVDKQPETSSLTIKTPTGEYTVVVSNDIVCKRIAPDAKSLEAAESITLGDIRIGDRVWARGTQATTQSAQVVTAKQLVLMSAESIAERNKRDSEAWMKRGIRGEITSVDNTKSEAIIKQRDGQVVTVSFKSDTEIRQYPPNSVDFSAAKLIKVSELKVGDSILARGQRSEDGQHFTAEMAVTGDVPRPTFGQVVSVNAEKGEINVKGRDKETTIKIAKETIVRFMPDFGQGQQNGNESRPANARPAGAGPRLMNPDALMEFMKRLPEIKISELKPGDFVVTNGPKSEDGTSLNAIFLVKVQAPTIRSSEGPTFGNFGGLFGGPGGGNQ